MRPCFAIVPLPKGKKVLSEVSGNCKQELGINCPSPPAPLPIGARGETRGFAAPACDQPSSASNAFAATKSGCPNPSVNQSQSGCKCDRTSAI